MQYTQTGSYLALAGILVSVLAHFNIVVGQDSIVAIIAGVVALVGVVQQYIAHKKLATIAGAR